MTWFIWIDVFNVNLLRLKVQMSLKQFWLNFSNSLEKSWLALNFKCPDVYGPCLHFCHRAVSVSIFGVDILWWRHVLLQSCFHMQCFLIVATVVYMQTWYWLIPSQRHHLFGSSLSMGSLIPWTELVILGNLHRVIMSLHYWSSNIIMYCYI